ncbi:MAG: hypothetical protein H6845_01905 [Alphaproteobacteria bacterium]|nr:MAG: hypothetical protein H6845_01905 [Alphaproteobacteria bacterium]
MKDRIIYNFIIAFFVILFVRLFYIYQKYDVKITLQNKQIRREILDCNGEVLAFTKQTVSLHKNTTMIDSKEIALIQSALQIKVNPNKFWIKRHLTDKELYKIKKLKLHSIGITNDHKRVYTHPDSLSHIIGYCDANLNGKAGIELALNDKIQTIPIELTIDIRLQNRLFNIVKEIYEEFNSENASGILIDIETGYIKAIVSYPSPNSKDPKTFLVKQNQNYHVFPVEMGSILKLHNAAMCLDNETVDLTSIVDATGTLRIADYEITDFFAKNSKMTFLESIRYSSNVATGRIALQVGKEVQQKFFKTIGFFDTIEWMPKHFAKPMIPKIWKQSTVITASYGYGIGLTMMHVVQGLMRILTGVSRNITLFPNYEQNEQIILKNKTIEDIKIAMRFIIENSYRSIDIKGYEIGGKTGTANMCENGRYIEGKNRVSYLGAFPMKRPKYVFLIQTTNPKHDKLKYGRYAVAANVLTTKVKEIIQEIASIENIAPTS